MRPNKNTKSLAWTLPFLFVFVTVLWVMPAGICAEDQKVNRIDQIQSPSEFDADEIDMDYIVKKRFDSYGPIDFINEDRIVIGDVAHEIAADASISNLSEGDYAGIQFNSWGQVVAAERLQGPPE